MSAVQVPPSDLVAAAMHRAVAVRVAGYRNDDRYDRFTLAALREQVVGLPARPQPRSGGWWAIGRILDDIGGFEWRVWMHPGRRILRMVPRRPPEPQIPVPTRRPDGRYYDGPRRRWVISAEEETTRQPLPAADASDLAGAT